MSQLEELAKEINEKTERTQYALEAAQTFVCAYGYTNTQDTFVCRGCGALKGDDHCLNCVVAAAEEALDET